MGKGTAHLADLPQRFEQSLRTGGLICRGEKIFVACSGGPDSVALIYLLAALSESWNLKLGVLHFNHALRGVHSTRDVQFVRKLAQHFKIPFYSAKTISLKKKALKNRLSLEEAGRHVRYAFFEKLAKRHKIQKIALAHTLDDQAETVLMRLVRGTGLRGLSAIRRILPGKHTQFVRPLLDFQKTELLGFLKSEKHTYRTDSSNQTPQFERNKIRLFFLPWLAREINPRVSHALARIPDLVAEENDLISRLEMQSWPRVLSKKTKAGKIIVLKRKVFSGLHTALQFRLLNRALRMLNARSGLDFETWRRIQAGLGRRRWQVSLPRNIDLALLPSGVVLGVRNTSRGNDCSEGSIQR